VRERLSEELLGSKGLCAGQVIRKMEVYLGVFQCTVDQLEGAATMAAD